MCFLQICLSERYLAIFNQQVLFENLHVRNLHSDKANCCLATFNQHYHFACKNALGHFHPSKHFAILSMCRKAKSPVTVCGNSRSVTFCSLERQNRKRPLSATDPAALAIRERLSSRNLTLIRLHVIAHVHMRGARSQPHSAVTS